MATSERWHWQQFSGIAGTYRQLMRFTDADAELTDGDPDRQPIALGARSAMAYSSYDQAICITKPTPKSVGFFMHEIYDLTSTNWSRPMSDYEDLRRAAEMREFPEQLSIQILELIQERSQLRQMAAGQEQVIKISHRTTTDQRQAIQRLQVQVSKMEELERELAQAKTVATELALENSRLKFDLDLMHKKNEALSAKLV